MKPARDTSCFAGGCRDLTNRICLDCPSSEDCACEQKMRELEGKYSPEQIELLWPETEQQIKRETEQARLESVYLEENRPMKSNVRPFPFQVHHTSTAQREEPAPAYQQQEYTPPQQAAGSLAPNGFVGNNPIAYAPRQEGESFWGRMAKNFVCEALSQGARDIGVSIQAEKFTPTTWLKRRPRPLPQENIDEPIPFVPTKNKSDSEE